MPSARSKAEDQGISLLVRALRRQRLSGDDLFQAFQDLDLQNSGFIASKSEVIDTLCDAIPAKYQRRIDFDSLLSGFHRRHIGFDYTKFCREYDSERSRSVEVPQNAQRLPSPRTQAIKSPPKSPSARKNWLLERQQRAFGAADGTDQSDADILDRGMRVDKRLEVQRILTQSIRRKLLHGIVGADYNGFLGLQETLFRLDSAGDGTLDEEIFKDKVLKRLKKPLTRQEIEFLSTNIRVSSNRKSAGSVIDYEQIGTFCNLDSDASADETEHESRSRRDDIPRAAGNQGSSELGADFLAAEQRLRGFLHQPVASNSEQSHEDTPRSVVTGAEQFLELAEQLDRDKSGYLPEAEYHAILTKCKVQVTPATLRSMLSRFPRTSDGKIPYLKFLEQYGQNPTRARERRRFKRVLQTLIVKAGKRVDEWMVHLGRRWEKLDIRSNAPLHRKTGRLSSEAFLRVLQGKDGVMPLSMDEATHILDLFLRVHPASTPSSLHYGEFLGILRDCYNQARATPSSPPPSPSHVHASHAPSSSVCVTDVAGYLIHHATAAERQHFESLMDALHKLHQRVQQQQRASSSAPRASTWTSESPGNVDDKRKGAIEEQKATAPAVDAVGDITAIENGICLPLGPRLHFLTREE
ncbi:hypothetical protein PINS_up009876 [Pythium insidiosum]|nr:hypothetical protein PINS_up009876 [Pythium insidiosum]